MLTLKVPLPLGSCAHIACTGTTLRPMHIHVSTWTLKVQGILTETPLTEPIGLPV